MLSPALHGAKSNENWACKSGYAIGRVSAHGYEVDLAANRIKAIGMTNIFIRLTPGIEEDQLVFGKKSLKFPIRLMRGPKSTSAYQTR